MNRDEMMVLLGEIKSDVEHIKHNHGAKLERIDTRLSAVEQRAAVNGTITGAIAAVGVSVIAASVKGLTGGGP